MIFTGQYITLSDLKKIKNGDKVDITAIVISKETNQITTSSSPENVKEIKYHFKSQKDVSVNYNTEDGKSNEIVLRNLIKVTLINNIKFKMVTLLRDIV